jgi:hypothetical protein
MATKIKKPGIGYYGQGKSEFLNFARELGLSLPLLTIDEARASDYAIAAGRIPIGYGISIIWKESEESESLIVHHYGLLTSFIRNDAGQVQWYKGYTLLRYPTNPDEYGKGFMSRSGDWRNTMIEEHAYRTFPVDSIIELLNWAPGGLCVEYSE